MSALIAILVTLFVGVVFISMTIKLLGIAITLAIGVGVYFLAEKIFGKTT